MILVKLLCFYCFLFFVFYFCFLFFIFYFFIFYFFIFCYQRLIKIYKIYSNCIVLRNNNLGFGSEFGLCYRWF